MTTPTFENNVDLDQMASLKAIWSGSTLSVMHLVNWMNILFQVTWLVDNQMWVWLNKSIQQDKGNVYHIYIYRQ